MLRWLPSAAKRLDSSVSSEQEDEETLVKIDNASSVASSFHADKISPPRAVREGSSSERLEDDLSDTVRTLIASEIVRSGEIRLTVM
jgi:hypothetical protein